MEAYCWNMFKDVRHERSLRLIISLTDPFTLKQSKFTDHEINRIKNLALEFFNGQKILKGCFAISIIK